MMMITGRIIPNPYARMFAARRMDEAFDMARGARAQVQETSASAALFGAAR